MIYPFIYTRTKYIDYRIVTTKVLDIICKQEAREFRDIARCLIDASNEQLENPSWSLIRRNGIILWGIAVLNGKLGSSCQDKTNRPVRGFFGFLAKDVEVKMLPFNLSFFKDLYSTYVTPIWESLDQKNEVMDVLSEAFMGTTIHRMPHECVDTINICPSLCRLFPNCVDVKSLIELVFSYNGNCGVATNIHKREQPIELGKKKISLMNVVFSVDVKQSSIEDVVVFNSTEQQSNIVTINEDENKEINSSLNKINWYNKTLQLFIRHKNQCLTLFIMLLILISLYLILL